LRPPHELAALQRAGGLTPLQGEFRAAAPDDFAELPEYRQIDAGMPECRDALGRSEVRPPHT
jgi:hypothetical protein